MTSAFLFFCMCVMCVNIYFWTSIKLMVAMYRKHRLEFWRHAPMMIPMHLLTYFGLVLFTLY